jgi:hypothetical protein
MDDAIRFIDLLLQDKPREQYALLWTRTPTGRNRSAWFQDATALCDHLATLVPTPRPAPLSQRVECYIGCGWTTRALGPHQRAKAEEIDAIPGLWVDIDCADGRAHKRTTLPPDPVTACDVIATRYPAPTCIVYSGHGAHLWWLFTTPWCFTDADDRALAAALVHAWQAGIRSLFQARGWELDNTADLARVLRIPGTWNYKVPDAPVQATLAACDGTRYPPEQLRRHLTQGLRGVLDPAVVPQQRVPVADIVLNPQAQPPIEKWELLREMDPRVKLSWEHRRRDLADTSLSGYDQSLATFAAQAGWTDQEIADLLIAHRRYHGGSLELRNPNYYIRTIRTARAATNRLQFTPAERALLDRIEAAEDPAATPDALTPLTDAERRQVLAILNTRLGMGWAPNPNNGAEPLPALQALLCYTSDPPQYWVELFNVEGHRRRVKMGDGKAIRDMRRWNQLVFDERRAEMPEFSKTEWRTIRRLIAHAIQRVDMGPVGTDAGQIRDWLSAYVGAHPHPIAWDERDAYLRDDLPFLSGRRAWFTLAGLLRWLRQDRGIPTQEADLRVRLTNAGARVEEQRYRKYPAMKHSPRLRKQVWSVPMEWVLLPDDLATQPEDASPPEEDLQELWDSNG